LSLEKRVSQMEKQRGGVGPTEIEVEFSKGELQMLKKRAEDGCTADGLKSQCAAVPAPLG